MGDDDLSALIAQVTDREVSTVAAAAALREIWDRRLAGDTPEDFLAFCRSRWSLTRLQVREAFQMLSTATRLKGQYRGHKFYERLLRPLRDLTPAEQGQVYAKAVELAGSGEWGEPVVTPAVIRRARSLLFPPQRAEKTEAELWESARKKWQTFLNSTEKLPWQQVKAPLRRIDSWLVIGGGADDGRSKEDAGQGPTQSGSDNRGGGGGGAADRGGDEAGEGGGKVQGLWNWPRG